MGRLEQRTAIITGAGSGIGKATALAMAREGALVLVVDLVAESAGATVQEIRNAGHQADSIVCDVSDPAAVDSLFAEVAEKFNYADILFNNAGISITGEAPDTSHDEWERLINVNLRGVWLCSRAFVARLRELDRPGSLINAASMSAFFPAAGVSAYAASKGGVFGLTKAMAIDYGRHGIRVNCVCPSIIETDMLVGWLESLPHPAETRRRLEEEHPLRRMGRPEEVAAAVVFLASEEASFITGSSINVDGGFTSGKELRV